jgi:mannose-6-phosphate isomerase-like protein (cupin superfamily)
VIDLQRVLAAATSNGPQWSDECEDLDITLLFWREGDHIAEHVNSEVDVVLIGLTGQGIVKVAGQEQVLTPGTLLIIPKGVPRSVTAGVGGFGQLNIHKRRKRLQVQMSRPKA